ncbi:hypothetical protein MITSMUL_04422 [Mitsuokella multacida DSM 20544]|uniref:Uncharacterized protein n=1 Tax=Mitsuokella multacida DSM 20544 TaxID=500635 RepID=C9KMI6_9FIRM|nr:hypothetical protein MITSMUL_04422 [Mitsuokella multacida DSM 20544]
MRVAVRELLNFLMKPRALVPLDLSSGDLSLASIIIVPQLVKMSIGQMNKFFFARLNARQGYKAESRNPFGLRLFCCLTAPF